MKKFNSIDPEKIQADYHHRIHKEDIMHKFGALRVRSDLNERRNVSITTVQCTTTSWWASEYSHSCLMSTLAYYVICALAYELLYNKADTLTRKVAQQSNFASQCINTVYDYTTRVGANLHEKHYFNALRTFYAVGKFDRVADTGHIVNTKDAVIAASMRLARS